MLFLFVQDAHELYLVLLSTLEEEMVRTFVVCVCVSVYLLFMYVCMFVQMSSPSLSDIIGVSHGFQVGQGSKSLLMLYKLPL